MISKSDEKKVRIWLGVAVGIIALVFIVVFFQFTDNSAAKFQFTVDDEEYATLMGYSGNAKTLKLPATDGKGHEVRYIADNAFGSHYSVLEKVEIPDTVREIGQYAFAECEKLEKVVLSKNLEKIGRGAFSGCTALDDIELPETLRVIDDQAFYGCIRLKELYIPAGVTDIGYDAFMSCENLRLDVSDNDIAAEVALQYNIETGKFDRTAVYFTVILAVSVIGLVGIAFLLHYLRTRKLPKKNEDGNS